MTATATPPGTILRTAGERQYLADDHAPHDARLYVRAAITQWRLSRISDDCQQVVSELAANAVAASRGTTIGVELQQTAGCVLIKVRDDSPSPPVRHDADLWSESGRGLMITKAFSTRTGYYSTGPGKIVWAELQI